MSCTSPTLAIITAVDEDGKKHISLKPGLLQPGYFDMAKLEAIYGKDRVLLLPCGKCDSCRMTKRKDWAIRCACEAKYHLYNSFVTLTYDDSHLPRDYKLKKSDLQKFIKGLRNKGHKLRYFACGEYGSNNGRPHYHLICFGYMPSDKKRVGKSNCGEAMYESKEVSDVWKKGRTIVQDFSPAAAGYVAGYAAKKLGDCSSFIIMSKRPGIGLSFASEKLNDIYSYDLIVGDFGKIKKYRPPRYFDKVAEKLGVDLTEIKAKRIKESNDNVLYKMRAYGYTRKEQAIVHDSTLNKKKADGLRRDL